MFVFGSQLFEKFINKMDSVSFETCDKAKFSVHTGKRNWLTITLVLPAGYDIGTLYVLEGVKKYDRSSNCEFEDVFTLVIRKSRNCNL